MRKIVYPSGVVGSAGGKRHHQADRLAGIGLRQRDGNGEAQRGRREDRRELARVHIYGLTICSRPSSFLNLNELAVPFASNIT